MRGHLPPIFANAAGMLPLLSLEVVARHLMSNAMAARPSFAARLGEYSGRTFAVDPVDCPFVFVLTPQDGGTHLSVVREAVGFDARIAAPLVVLLGMIDGTYDGDALFFSRDLSIEGDTEAVLALRNAIENADLDLSTVLGFPQAMQGPVNRAARQVFMRVRRLLDAPEDSGPNGVANGVNLS
ncbi:MAG: SCP2 sterol-binding domain-containing protein [Rhizomicrobium sp.]|nr:SCP2 sterol-binding domain-containing protein [Rhizomicrobium sp.]